MVERRVRISIKLLIDICLRFGGFDGLDDMYGPLRTPFGRIYCELCPSVVLAGCMFECGYTYGLQRRV